MIRFSIQRTKLTVFSELKMSHACTAACQLPSQLVAFFAVRHRQLIYIVLMNVAFEKICTGVTVDLMSAIFHANEFSKETYRTFFHVRLHTLACKLAMSLTYKRSSILCAFLDFFNNDHRSSDKAGIYIDAEAEAEAKFMLLLQTLFTTEAEAEARRA